MKKLSLLILFSTCLFLFGCNSEEINDLNDSNDKIQIDKGLLKVTVNIPSDLANLGDDNIDTEEYITEVENSLKENYSSVSDVKINENGSLSYSLSKTDYNKIKSDMKKDFQDNINSLIESVDYSIKDVTYNNDFSELKVYVDKEMYESSFDSLTLFGLSISSMFYQVFEGKNENNLNVQIQLIDEKTNDLFDTLNYPED